MLHPTRYTIRAALFALPLALAGCTQTPVEVINFSGPGGPLGHVKLLVKRRPPR